ncbi:hypothetical protein RRG08_025996 [Elysia crispata]|uniref:Uncharacterized protein n=1 Tax=Elysia crispata TaxID=231223 RepID=A0AAE1EAF1_9GAST|nr:hypothetical protein RRG08_025996 [Elysia crispata]
MPDLCSSMVSFAEDTPPKHKVRHPQVDSVHGSAYHCFEPYPTNCRQRTVTLTKIVESRDARSGILRGDMNQGVQETERFGCDKRDKSVAITTGGQARP